MKALIVLAHQKAEGSFCGALAQTAAETLTAAGWMKESHWSNVIIIRDGLSHPRLYKVDVDGILAGKCRNVPLKAGDIVYVPKDDLSEYNVFVKKLLPTAQLFSLIAGRASTVGIGSSN